MAIYTTSTGERLEKSTIDSRIKKAKETYLEKFIDDYLYHYCERSLKTGVRLECSHIVSVRECQHSGRSELAYDLKNIELLSHDEHMIIEGMANKAREAWYLARQRGMTFENFLLFNNIDIQEKNNLFNNQ